MSPKKSAPSVIVFLNNAASEETFEKVRNYLDYTAANDPQWQGVRFRVFRELYTWVGEDSARAARLFEQVRGILMQEPFEHPEMIA